MTELSRRNKRPRQCRSISSEPFQNVQMVTVVPMVTTTGGIEHLQNETISTRACALPTYSTSPLFRLPFTIREETFVSCGRQSLASRCPVHVLYKCRDAVGSASSTNVTVRHCRRRLYRCVTYRARQCVTKRVRGRKNAVLHSVHSVRSMTYGTGFEFFIYQSLEMRL